MSNVSVELAPYFRRVESHLDCPRKVRKQLMERVRRAAEEFVAERPDATREEVEEYLGDPKEVAQEMMKTLDPEESERYQKSKKVTRMLIYGIIAAVVIILALGFIHLTLDTRPAEIIETIVIYPEEEIIP